MSPDMIFDRIAESVVVPADKIRAPDREFRSEDILDYQESRFVQFYDRRAFLLYDGLYAAASVGNYIYRSKGIRFFWFEDGTIAYSSVHAQIDKDGFSLTHEILDEAPLSDIGLIAHYWRDAEYFDFQIEGVEDASFLLHSLSNINAPYRRAYFLEYLLNPKDVQSLSQFSLSIRSSIWNSIFNYILGTEALDPTSDEFLIFVLELTRRAEIEPPVNEIIHFSKGLIQSPGSREKLDRVLEFVDKNLRESDVDTSADALATMLNFKDFIERQAHKDIYVEKKPQENIARGLLQSFVIGRSYREVPVRGGKTDLLVFQKKGRSLYETKIWRGKEYHEQGIRELEEYIKGEGGSDLLDVFYLVFDPTLKQEASKYIADQGDVTIEGKKVNIVPISIYLPYPSKAI